MVSEPRVRASGGRIRVPATSRACKIAAPPLAPNARFPEVSNVATEDAVKPTAPAPAAPGTATGHPVAFWFFFWGEFAERSSYYGMRAILSLYMTDRLGFSEADGGTFMALFIAGCYFLPLLGGYLADNFFGKYWTIVGFSIPYLIGQYIVGIENKYVVV